MASSSDDRLGVLFFIGSMGGGGAERQLVEALKRLDRQRFRPVLALHHRQGPLLDEVPVDVPIHSFWEGFSGTWRAKWHHVWGTTDRARWSHLVEVIRQERIDLVFNQTYLATLDAAQACAAAKVPRISVCVAAPLEEIALYDRGNRSAALDEARQAFTTGDRVLAVSSGIRDALVQDLGVPSDQITVFPNMIDVGEAERLSRVESLALDPKRFHVLTVGRLSEEKGHLTMLDALCVLRERNELGNLLWHVIGTGPLEEELRRQVAERGLTAAVEFSGFVRNPYPWYRAADVLCLPSRHEAFGCVLTEALACRLPIVATDCPSGPREVLSDGAFGKLVPVGDSAFLAEALADMRAHLSVWRDRANAGHAVIQERYSFKIGMSRLHAMFEDVVAEQRRAIAASKLSHSG